MKIRKTAIAVSLTLAGASLPSIPSSAGVADGSEVGSGRAIFRAKNCQYCHSVERAAIGRGEASEKMRGPDLSAAHVATSVEEVLRFLKKGEVQPEAPPAVAPAERVDHETHWKTFWGTEEEAHRLAEWLVGLRRAAVPATP